MVVWIDWQLALIALALAPLFFLSQRFVAPKTGRASRQFTQERAKLLSVEEQTLGNLKGISAFTNEETMAQKHRRQFDIARQWALKVRNIRVWYNTFSTFLIYFAGVIIIYSGISSIESGRLSIGVLVSFLIYIRNLTNPVRTIARMPIQLHADRIAAERVMEILNTKANVKESDSSIELKIKNADIKLINVTFSYPNSAKTVFNNLTAHICAGETVALIGPSGSGKSSFANLLLRFFDPQSGSITIDDTDIKSVALKSLRQQISIVWQEPFIINGSVKDNLLLANPNASNEQLKSACISSHSWEFIQRLENGMDTVLGANGENLSVGQNQRLAIAQAFLRDTPILILDEASSALDSFSEQVLVDAVQSLRKNRTTLVIAHRFSTIRSADRIFYFNGNGTVTAGTHEDLMRQHAGYKNAVDWQIIHV